MSDQVSPFQTIASGSVEEFPVLYEPTATQNCSEAQETDCSVADERGSSPVEAVLVIDQTESRYAIANGELDVAPSAVAVNPTAKQNCTEGHEISRSRLTPVSFGFGLG